MSYFKFSENLFLSKQELDRLKLFLDTDGYRARLLNESLSFGLVKKEFFDTALQNEFLNGLVTEGATLSLDYQAITAIDSDGNVISLPAGNIATTGNNSWYWVKIKYAASPVEVGVVAVDVNGNLTGDSNCRFTEVLRGQPNFPTRIKFTDSASNLLEYDILEVIDDYNAILDNSTFTAETGLHFKVVGTFTPASVPAESDKYPFQYDSCELSLVLETVSNTPPTFITGKEFFLARIKNSGVALTIQDKRTSIWKTKANFLADNLRLTSVPNFGIEKVKYNDANSPLDKNLVYLSWAFRSSNYSVNSNLNIVTINGGQGGKFKTVADFTTGDFNGYRIYTSDGSYAIIKASIKTGSQINLYLNFLDIDKYSVDGGTTFTGNQILVTPDAEEINVICKAQEDHSESNIHLGEVQLSDHSFNFPINTDLAVLELLVYDSPNAIFEITYRLKHTDRYSEIFTMASDVSFGYYTEKAFDASGDYLPIVAANTYIQNLVGGYIAIYVTGLLTLTINPNAYSILIDKLDSGDLFGVDTVELVNVTPQVTLTVGENRNYQHFVGSILVLSADMFIILNKFKANLSGLTNGNSFLLHFTQNINLNGFRLRIVTDFVNIGSFTLVKEILAKDTAFIFNSPSGLMTKVTINNSNSWIYKDIDQVSYDFVIIDSYSRYRKDSDGYVHIESVIGSGYTANDSIVLPTGYRPLNTITAFSLTADIDGGGIGIPTDLNVRAFTINSSTGILHSNYITGAGANRQHFIQYSFKAEQ